MLAAAKRPTLYVGVGLRRHGLTELVDRLPASDRPIPRFSGSSIPQL